MKTLQQSLQKLPPVKDVSYIKPGPVGAFKIWQNTMDSYNTTVPIMNQAQQLGLVPPQLPAPPTQLSLPAPPTQSVQPAPPAAEKPLTLENFKQVLSMMREHQQPPLDSWGRELIDDDDEPRMPDSPAFSTMSKRNYLEDEMDFTNELENSVAEVYGLDPNDPETKETSKEVQQILSKAFTGVETSNAKRLGTLHGNRKLLPENIRKSDSYMKYKDTEAYKMTYNKAYNEQISKDQDDISEITEVGRTRAGKKKVQISDPSESGVTERSRQRERERLKRELEELNNQIPDFGDFENFDIDTELAKAGLTRIEEF
jgi:hypothetical protein